MYRKALLMLLLSLLLMALVFSAYAQNDSVFVPEDDSTSASVSLESGFALDPYLLRVIGGGSMPASDLRSTCSGFVRPEPNVVFNWSGETDMLEMFTYSDDDMVLVVELPNGDYVCSDDANKLVLDAVLSFQQPQDGEYRVWVGAIKEDVPTVGFLVMTEGHYELANLDLTSLLLRHPDPTETAMLDVGVLKVEKVAVFGTQTLQPGFESISLEASGGGDLALGTVATGNTACTGFASTVPTLSFTWSGESDGVRVIFEGKEDSSLVVLTPEGKVLCNDDSNGDANVNPAVNVENPVEGQYEVFVASNGPESIVTGSLTITEDLSEAPAALPRSAQ